MILSVSVFDWKKLKKNSKKKNMKAILLLIYLFLFANSLIYAEETVFVSTAGNDDSNCGAITVPCASIAFAVNKSGGGDIFLLPGRHFITQMIDVTMDLHLYARQETFGTTIVDLSNTSRREYRN